MRDLEERIRRFVREPGDEGQLARLALAAWRWQSGANPRLDAVERRRRDDGGRLDDWRDIPLVPTLAYRSDDLGTRRPERTFLSSGTSTGARSRHPHGFLDLYRTVIETTFPAACLPAPPPVPMLSLIPSSGQQPDSSLAFMVDHVMRRFGSPESTWALGERGVELSTARSWLGAAQRRGLPVVVLATTIALDQLLQGLRRRYLHFRLPPGSVLFETGGSKGSGTVVDRGELLDAVQEWLGLGRDRVVQEYGMTELTSHFYASPLHGGEPGVFLPPPWTRVRILSPESLTEQTAGGEGLIAVLDLANLSSAVHLLTEDLGVAEGEGFRLRGRAAGAQLRGCSLVAEELARS